MSVLQMPAPRPVTTAPAGGPETVAVTASGCHVGLSDGRRVLDACSGAVNVNLGHGNEAVTDAIHRQLATLDFAYRSHFRTPACDELRERLAGTYDGRYPACVFTNSGSEAVEQALRVASAYHDTRGQGHRHIVLAEWPSYHGMTLAALAASGHPLRRAPAGALLAPLRSNFQHVHAPDAAGGRATAAAWTQAIAAAGDDLAAVVVEPVGGASSGAAVAPPATLAAIREAATRAGALVIADEVMSGLGRLGEWSPGVEHGLGADIVAVSKGLGSGYYPVGAALLADAVAQALAGDADYGSFGHTMAGNPVAAATGLAVMDQLAERGSLAHVRALAPLLRATVEEAVAGAPCVGEPRGYGFLLAVPVTPAHAEEECCPACAPGGAAVSAGGQDGSSACGCTPAALRDGTLLGRDIDEQVAHSETALLAARRLAAAALDAGLLVYPAGVSCATACVLVAPPLVADEPVVAELGERLREAVVRGAIDRTEPERS